MRNKNFTYTYKFETNPYPGLFIAFEGIDGSGSTTKVEKFYDFFVGRGIQTVKTEEPSSGPVGSIIRWALSRGLQIDPRTLQLMFTTDRSDHLFSERGIVGSLKKGITVLSSRYLASTPAFGYSEEEDIDFLIAAQSKFFLPDLMFFLDVKPEVSVGRLKNTRSGIDRFETLERLKKAYRGYQLLLKKFPGMMIPINGEEEVEVVMNSILVHILEHPKFKRLLKRPR